jgi:hypothetical protein
MWLLLAAFMAAGMPLLLRAPRVSASGTKAAREGRATPVEPLRFEVSFDNSLNATPLNGRLYLLISTNDDREPRFQISDQPETQQFFGINVDGWGPGLPAVFDAKALGYPLDSIAQIPAGDYTVQALLNIYTTFHRADGHTVELPMDEGEGQQWNRKPGNPLSTPMKVHIDPAAGGMIQIHFTHKIRPDDLPEDTEYIKHFKIQSAVLSKFWGRPMYLGAQVLLPAGWAEHPNAHYPLMVLQGHFQPDIFGGNFFRTTPPEASLSGRERKQAEYGYAFYQDWISGRLPRMIILEIQHANPYYDDSYAVDSANVGPYGTAIMRELLPEVEKRYRAIGQGWARGLYGGSTGGWEALADQVFYPDDFNGTWASCPDPVDFRAYQIVNIHDDENALWLEGPWSRIPRPAVRRPDGTVVTTMERENQRELVLGDHGRSTEQFGIWQAVFSPVGKDGYPQPIWDPLTGVIDHSVAKYWGEHYDLRAILERNWPTLGPKLAGKIHVNVGTRDTYYLDNAVRLLEKFLESAQNPKYGGDFHYGYHQPHCWTGGNPNLTTGSMTINQRVLPDAAAWMTKTAPAGADVKSWKY